MRIPSILLIILLFLFLPVAASAADLRGQSRTYLQAREDVDDHTLLPVYEYLDFSLNDFAAEGVSFQVGGWVRQDLTHEQSFDDRSFNGDLQYGYLGWNRESTHSFLGLGRVPVYGGVASELVDGMAVRTDLLGGFAISGYGGIPVESDFDDRDGDSIYGGRLSHKIPGLYRIGASYLKERNDSSDFRTEAGADLWIHPLENVEITGWSTYNGETSDWMEHTYYLTAGPFAGVRIATEFSAIDYRDFFSAVDSFTTSVFNLQPGIINPQEELVLWGGEIEYALRDPQRFSVALDYKHYDYEIADTADYYGGRLVYGSPGSWGTGLSFHRMDGGIERLKYYESRIYGFMEFKKTDITLDLFNVNYDEKIADVKNAYSASLALGYDMTDKARLSADIEYAHNPTFDDDVRGFVKFLYNFGQSPEL